MKWWVKNSNKIALGYFYIDVMWSFMVYGVLWFATYEHILFSFRGV